MLFLIGCKYAKASQRLTLVEDDREVLIGERDGLGVLIGESVGKKAAWNRQTEARGQSVADLLSTTSALSHLGQLRVCHRTMSRTNENLRTEGQIPSVRLQAKRLSSRHNRIDLAQRRRKLPFRSILRLSYGLRQSFPFSLTHCVPLTSQVHDSIRWQTHVLAVQSAIIPRDLLRRTRSEADTLYRDTRRMQWWVRSHRPQLANCTTLDHTAGHEISSH